MLAVSIEKYNKIKQGSEKLNASHNTCFVRLNLQTNDLHYVCLAVFTVNLFMFYAVSLSFKSPERFS